MKRHTPLSLPGLSRRSVLGRAVVVGAALGLGSRLGRALAQDASPSAGPVEFLWETRGDPASPLTDRRGPRGRALAIRQAIKAAGTDPSAQLAAARAAAEAGMPEWRQLSLLSFGLPDDQL